MTFVEKLKKLGIKPGYEIWEIFLIRKINFLLSVAFFNVTLAYILFPLLGVEFLQPILLLSVVMAPLVMIMNIRWGYVAGSYGFFLFGIFMISFLAIRLGANSFSVLFFFPITLSIVQLLGRRETRLHMMVNLAVYFGFILFTIRCYYFGQYAVTLSPDVLKKVQVFNSVLSSFTAIVFIAQITTENNRQEKRISDALREKEILLAEVFHRVKNNMNIVTSLLNLKKNTSSSEEVRDALEECRNRVYSMALVHQKIYERDNLAGVNFGEYVRDLVNEITSSMGTGKQLVQIHSELIDLPINQAIPCGLILNELLTNSFKHAVQPDRKLEVTIDLSKHDHNTEILYRDNGPGISGGQMLKPESMGIDLIQSLCQQLDGTYSFENNNGLQFHMKF
ncbi:MAG: hypothetical protein Fur0041_15590 [Bacteroidia bacterium]